MFRMTTPSIIYSKGNCATEELGTSNNGSEQTCLVSLKEGTFILVGKDKERIDLALGKAPFKDPAVPVIANATATATTTATDARRLLAEQLTAPVRWVGCMEAAARLAPGVTFVEIGPGNVLSGLVKRIVPGANTMALGTADEVEKFMLSDLGQRPTANG